MTTTDFLLDSLLALALGSLIGLERQVRQHPAGGEIRVEFQSR